MAVIFVRGQAVEVPDHTATVLAGLGAESYIRLGELWNQDQQQRYASAGQQQKRPTAQPHPAPARVSARGAVDQEAEAREERRAAIAEMARGRGQVSW